MKEELQGKLVEILTSIQTAAGKASDFALAELPDIAQSYIAYGQVVSIVGVCVGLLLLVGAAWFAWLIWWQNQNDDPIFLNMFGGMAAFISAVIGALVLGSSLNSALLVWFAPKVWLLKEIASLLK